MFRGLLGTGLVLIGASWALAFGHGGGPPTQQMIRVQPNGQLQVYYQVMKCVPETQTRKVQEKVPVTKEVQEEVNGEIRKRTVTEYQIVSKDVAVTVTRTVCEMKVRAVNPDKVKAFETDGRAISPKQLAQRAAGDTLVVISPNGDMIPDYYAGLFKPGTIIIAIEQQVARPMEAPEPPAGESSPRPSAARESTLIRTVSAPSDDAVDIRIPQHAPSPTFPATMPPVFVFASREGADSFKLRQMTEYSYQATACKVRKQGTGKQMVPLTMTQTVRHNEITTISGQHLKFFAGEGTAVSADRVKEKLSRESTVLYSADGEDVDSFWLQNLKATTLVIVGPQLPGGCGGPMGYAVPCAPAMPAPVLSPPSTPQAAPAPVEAIPQPKT